MRRLTRFVAGALVAGALVGGGAFVGYLLFVGIDGVVERVAAVTLPAIAAVVLLVAAEGVSDAVGGVAVAFLRGWRPG